MEGREEGWNRLFRLRGFGILSLPPLSQSLLAACPATPPLGPSLSTSCPLLRKSMRPARPLLNPVTHDWNIPRFSAFIRGLFTGTRFNPLPPESISMYNGGSISWPCVCVRVRALGDSIRRVDWLVVLGLVEKPVVGRLDRQLVSRHVN